MNDAAFLELLASTLTTLERSILAIRTLVGDHESRRRPSDQALNDYRAQCLRVERNIVDMRALVSAFKREFPTH